MNTEMLIALEEFIDAKIAEAIEKAFGRDSLIEGIRVSQAGEELWLQASANTKGEV